MPGGRGIYKIENGRKHGARGSTEGRHLFSTNAAACGCVLRPQPKPTRYGHAMDVIRFPSLVLDSMFAVNLLVAAECVALTPVLTLRPRW